MSNFLINSYSFTGPTPGLAAQNFDGSDDRFDVNTTWFTGGDVEALMGIVSFWARRDGSGSDERIFSSTGNRVIMSFLIADTFVFGLTDSSGASKLSTDSGATTITDANWHHFLIAWDLTVGTGPLSWMYIDDVDVESVTTLATSPQIDVTHTTNRFGANSSATPNRYLNGCLAEFYWRVNETLDMDTTSNRRKFIDASGNPVDLGADGSTPTGTQPEVYFQDDFTDNLGTLANPGATGSPAACSDSPG